MIYSKHAKVNANANRIHTKRPVFCVNCKYFMLPPHTNNQQQQQQQQHTKYGLCRKFPLTMDDNMPAMFYVTGLYPNTNINTNTTETKYQEALLCRAIAHLCGKEGLHFDSNQVVE